MARDESQLRFMVISAVMGALGLALPIVFHMVGLGSKFLPMLIPLLLNGFLVPWNWAALTGALVPLASALLTGMPPLYPPVAVVMSVEAGLMAAVASGVYRSTRPRLWPAMVAAVAIDRVASFTLTWMVARSLGLPPTLASVTSFLQSLPGVALLLVVVPLAVRSLQKRRSILFSDESEP